LADLLLIKNPATWVDSCKLLGTSELPFEASAGRSMEDVQTKIDAIAATKQVNDFCIPDLGEGVVEEHDK
jgi:hypothetical protein